MRTERWPVRERPARACCSPRGVFETQWTRRLVLLTTRWREPDMPEGMKRVAASGRLCSPQSPEARLIGRRSGRGRLTTTSRRLALEPSMGRVTTSRNSQTSWRRCDVRLQQRTARHRWSVRLPTTRTRIARRRSVWSRNWMQLSRVHATWHVQNGAMRMHLPRRQRSPRATPQTLKRRRRRLRRQRGPRVQGWRAERMVHLGEQPDRLPPDVRALTVAGRHPWRHASEAATSR
jgi:hypothetical protein